MSNASFSSTPTFVACCGRSGSTLLRWLIDAHPEIGCPGETDAAVFLSGYVKMAADLLGRFGAESPEARGRAVIEELFTDYLTATGKTRWCDKSLSNVFHLDLLSSSWPEARFILLYRHCMDFVMNGIEVSPWGLVDYGFSQVAQRSPTDSVVALVAYWIDRTTRMLAFEQENPERCVRLRYEDLVANTDAVLEEVWNFLGVDVVPGMATRAFEIEHSTLGAADHEIWYTHGIHQGSVGEDARIPPDHVVGSLRANLNDLLGRLDYEAVTDSWGSATPSEPVAATHSSFDAGSPLIELRVVERHQPLWQGFVDLARCEIVDRGTSAPSGFVVAVERGALGSLSDGEENIGIALRNRTVRPYGTLPAYFRDEREIFEQVALFLREHGTELS